MADKLDTYRAKRDPSKTPEPFDDTDDRAGRATDGAGGNRFVIQQHSATRLHWDLRIEHEGTLPSWALPKGVPWSPDRDHLAVRTEDHPLQYLTFHGEIPEGQYGAGSMTIWDEGTREIVSWSDRKVVVDLHGGKVDGRYALFATRGKDWMIHRMDPPADPTRRPPPEDLRPMEPTPGDAPTGDGWAWEARWHGLRVLITNEPGDVRIAGPDGDDVGDRFPELKRIGRAVGAVECVLDGVVVDGGSGALAARMQASGNSIRRLSTDRPVQVVLTDAIWWEGHPAWLLAWTDRRALLDSLELTGPAWTTPTAHVGDGRDVVAAARGAGVDALVAKRVDGAYEPGATSDAWVLVRL